MIAKNAKEWEYVWFCFLRHLLTYRNAKFAQAFVAPIHRNKSLATEAHDNDLVPTARFALAKLAVDRTLVIVRTRRFNHHRN
jgi:hypothetical protein